MKTVKFTGGVLVGLGIGALTALLLAPQSGELSREQLQSRIDEIVAAGRKAARRTEDELYSRWETEMAEANQEKSPEDSADKALADARKAADEAAKREEAKRKEAEEHIEKARGELEKARKAI